ncbi:helix-turn-helix domain-containing protein [Streptomyces sp. G45]|uniref:helix-turn-helix domain-containing protein n=1 Tax=Streptomyces sp. G45 TaxID=3406627 RepID=UPI003C288794
MTRGTSPPTACVVCDAPLVQRPGAGRRRRYCGTACRRRAQRLRQARAASAKDQQGPLGRSVAAEVHRLARQLLDAEARAEDLGALLDRAEAVRREVEIYTAAAVQDARHRGAKWEAIAEAAHVAPDTARSRWKPERVARMMDLHANDKRVTPPRPRQGGARRRAEGDEGAGTPGMSGVTRVPGAARAQGTAGAAQGVARAAQGVAGVKAPVGAKGPVGRPQDATADTVEVQTTDSVRQLASALTQLQANSGMTIREVADSTRLSPSFISRVLSGDRLPNWDLVCSLAVLFDSDPADLHMLYEAAHGITAPARQSVVGAIAALHAAVRGLYLAARRPPVTEIQRRSGNAVSATVVRRTLAGLDVPEWPDLQALITALGGRPADIKPLWEAVHYTFLMCDDPRRPDGAEHAAEPRRTDR